jgi:glycosyltransferase involved in cell wall biosynthesis
MIGGTNDPVKVLYSFPHSVGAPGIGTTALQQIRGLRAAGAEVSVVCASVRPGVELANIRTTLALGGRRIPHRVFGSVDRALAYHDGRVAKEVVSGEYDVVHTWPSGALKTLRAARSAGVIGSRESPNTHTANAYAAAAEEARRLGIEIAPGQSHRTNLHRLRRELEEFNAADLILVPSDRVERSFLDAGIPLSRLRRHRYGFDPTVFTDRGRDDTSDRPFTVVFLGSAEPRKGLHYALEAWRRSGAGSDSRFLVAGTFAPGYRERIAGLLDQPGVVVLGFTDDAPGLLRTADALLLPSIEEGSALVAYEAQASGCVPLVSRSAGANITHGREGLIHEDRDVGVLAEHIARLHRDPVGRAQLRAAGIAAAPSLTWNAAGVRMLEIFRLAVSGAA